MIADKMKSETFDVVVVGGGGAGLAAAAEAARLGRSVVLLEKNPKLGGSTAWSVGSMSITNSPHQQRCGIQDTPQAHFEDLELLAGKYAPRDNLKLRRILVESTTDMFEWLRGLGLVFAGPMPEPPHRVDRMHLVLPNSRAFPYHVGRHCRKLGVDIRLDTCAEKLIVENGRVLGVRARTGAHVAEYRARGGVVLGSGDYSAGRDLKLRLAGETVAELEAVNVTATGDGHRIALEAGATVVNGDIVRGPIMRFVPPPHDRLMLKLPPWRWLARGMRWSMDHLPDAVLRPFAMSFLTTALGVSMALFKHGAILVNRDGRRYADELANPAHAVPDQRDKKTWIVFDHTLAQRFTAWPHYISTAPGIAYAYLADYRRNRADIYHEAATVEGLARSMDVPADALARTLSEYNGGERGARPAIAAAPYYALGPVKSYVIFTDGGLKVTERLEVTREDGAVIPGLYAAGSTGQGGLLLEGHGHHLGWAFISGRIAGRNAAFGVARNGDGKQ
ncbi:MAG TPA: FAD-dependent oxidoreductase [Burkholderiales bacterium]|nr:FAD-dependent oxidoreductase [Burkholderiales bacterium]